MKLISNALLQQSQMTFGLTLTFKLDLKQGTTQLGEFTKNQLASEYPK